MRAGAILPCLVVCLCVIPAATVWAAEANPEDIEIVFKTLRATSATEPPRVLQTDEGFLRYLGAPPGASYHALTPPAKAADPEAAARAFISSHGRAFGVTSECVAFRRERVNLVADRAYVRLQQTYDGLDVFCAQMILQLDDRGGVSSVLSDILRSTDDLDSGDLTTSPTVSADDARAAALREIAVESPAHEVADLDTSAGPTLMVYDPGVLSLAGPVGLAWYMVVVCPFDIRVREIALVDAHSGEVVLHFNNVPESKRREIYDANNTYDFPGTLVRAEGQPACGIEDADLAYDYLGDTYDFYFSHHDRDSIDGVGMTLLATVRACLIYYYQCPWQNASWSGERMIFGDGMMADDVTAHELTHGVTDYESQLIYMGESGAINESFSDIWGEFIDLTNGRGMDTPEVRWLMGEDTPMGAIRNMADPPEFGDPDRMGSPYWVPTSWWWDDNGGVHSNSGVSNKLCYLLTDGDFFNGYTIEPLSEDSVESIARVADLFYDLQANLLGPASDYHDMYMQLAQATINQGYSFGERMNVRNAGYAVEINPPAETGIRYFRATPAFTSAGDPVIALTWDSPQSATFRGVTLVRKLDGFPEDPADGTVLHQGTDEKFLDTDVLKDTAYYYGLFADFRRGFPQVEYVRGIAGIDPPDPLTEAFDVELFEYLPDAPDLSQFIDLQGCQVELTPIGGPVFPLGSNQFYTDYTQYEATVTKGHIELPVPREDEEGGAYSLPMTDDSVVILWTGSPFPFFNGKFSEVYLSSNGYVSFQYVSTASADNFPSLESHFAIPRISFLFADLNPGAGGEVWARYLKDRLVVTFEQVPEWLPLESWYGAFPQAPWSNTVQLEMYFSGKIRITYLETSAVNVVCGLSDGRGVPVIPTDLFPGLVDMEVSTNLSELPGQASRLSIVPAGYQEVLAGELVHFPVETVSPSGVPTLSAEWDGPGPVPFADNGDGTGLLHWLSGLDQDGIYTTRIHASRGAEQAYQDVTLYIGDPDPKPLATNVRLRSEDPFEDPTMNRGVDVNSKLIAEYTYVHPLESVDPDRYEQGIPLLYWFKNESLIPAFTNHFTVPASVTRAGEQWFFIIIPRTAWGVRGDEVMSPIVTILAMPTITDVSPSTGPAIGGTTVTLQGERLDRPTGVTFGGIPVQQLRSISDTEIEVLTPAHAPGPVDIVTTTIEGNAFLAGGFAYLGEEEVVVKADINHDGVVDAQDVQLVITAVLERTTKTIDADANCDGAVNSLDVQAVVNKALNPNL
jgi:Zn-dependent metalloprotease